MYGRFLRYRITNGAILDKTIGKEGTILGRVTNIYNGSLFVCFFMLAFMYEGYRVCAYNEYLILLVL